MLACSWASGEFLRKSSSWPYLHQWQPLSNFLVHSWRTRSLNLINVTMRLPACSGLEGLNGERKITGSIFVRASDLSFSHARNLLVNTSFLVRNEVYNLPSSIVNQCDFIIHYKSMILGRRWLVKRPLITVEPTVKYSLVQKDWKQNEIVNLMKNDPGPSLCVK